MTPQSERRGLYLLTVDPARIDVDAAWRFLNQGSYWSQGIARDTVARSIANSLCFAILHDEDGQIGFMRFVTDRATFAYMADVYVLPTHRGQGLSKWMIGFALDHPDLQNLRRVMLATRDAHDLYAQFGFAPLGDVSMLMQRHDPDIYRRESALKSAEPNPAA